jgi:hypothetical protein
MCVEQIRSVLELIYYATAPVLALLAFWGLKQLGISKDAVRVSAQRDALRMSAEQCVVFANEIIPLTDELDRLLATGQCALLTTSKVDITEKGFRIRLNLKDFDTPTSLSILSKALAITNRLESFSLYFVAGVAVEEVAFASRGATFCNETKKLFPIIACGMHQHPPAFKNLLSLFFLWNNRITAQQLTLDQENLAKRLHQIENKVITPFGVAE